MDYELPFDLLLLVGMIVVGLLVARKSRERALTDKFRMRLYWAFAFGLLSWAALVIGGAVIVIWDFDFTHTALTAVICLAAGYAATAKASSINNPFRKNP